MRLRPLQQQLGVAPCASRIADRRARGACQAPQTTAMRLKPSRWAARMAWRMCASRCASSSSRGVDVRAQRRHRFQDALEEAGHVAPLLDLALPPQLVVVVARRLRQQREWVLARRDGSRLAVVAATAGASGATALVIASSPPIGSAGASSGLLWLLGRLRLARELDRLRQIHEARGELRPKA